MDEKEHGAKEKMFCIRKVTTQKRHPLKFHDALYVSSFLSIHLKRTFLRNWFKTAKNELNLSVFRRNLYTL